MAGYGWMNLRPSPTSAQTATPFPRRPGWPNGWTLLNSATKLIEPMSTETDNLGTIEWSDDELIPFGKYVLLNRISSGGTAAVYRAKVLGEAGFERLVAIKRILPHMAGDPEFVNTFVREAKTVARLSHTNICPVYELGRVGESLYTAMEYVPGKDLGRITIALQKRERAIPPILAAWIAMRLCDALDYAHSLKNTLGNLAGVVHRDLSPPNILISYDGEVKLIDFGLAKAVGRAQQTNVDALRQKLGYMSPEMVRGKPIDSRSDIFGVGVLLYEMLTERRLFAGTDDMATLRLLGNASVPPPSAFTEDVPEALELIVMRALQREPEMRYQTAGEMGQALSEYVVSENPLYGPRNVAAIMEDLFQEKRDNDQERLRLLLSASGDHQILLERQRYFASPEGAAAIARAELTKRMSTQPAGQEHASPEVPKAAPVPQETSEIEEKAAPTESAEQEAIATSGEAAAAPEGPFADEATQALSLDDAEEILPLPAAQPPLDVFQEEPTEIYFNKEEGIGLAELGGDSSDNDGGFDDLVSHQAPSGSANPFGSAAQQHEPAIEVAPEPPVSYPPPSLSAPPPMLTPRRAPRGRAATMVDLQRKTSQRNERVANGMLIVGVFLLSLSLVGLVLRTPLGEKLGLRRSHHGTIEIRTVPAVNAAVKLDQVYRGQAPLRLDRVPLGGHRVVVEASGYNPTARDIAITEGGTTTVIEIALEQ